MSDKIIRCHKYCQQDVHRCERCHSPICLTPSCTKAYEHCRISHVTPSKPHEACVDCKKFPTCDPIGICDACIHKHYYHMITEDVAIGDNRTPYDSFDIIVNLDHNTYNGVKDGEIRVERRGEKYMIRGGFYDSAGMTMEHINRMLLLIESVYQPESKILFHCFAGVSRSSTVAIVYLSRKLGLTIQEAYQLAKSKRPFIDPNKDFRKVIGLSKDNLKDTLL